MSESIMPPLQEREQVNAYFQSQSSYWKDIYMSGGVQGEIYRERHAAVLAWIDNLALAPGSQVLEIGCGAGFLAVALAQRGLRVCAIDSTSAMVELARRHATESGASEQLSVDSGDIYALGFEDRRFDLVVAIGVIPWLERPELAIQEIARVTRTGGHVILTADNRSRLIYLFDPWLNPALQPLRKRVKHALERFGLHRWLQDATNSTLHDHRYIDNSLARLGLIKSRSMTLGFGPFSLFKRKILSEPLSTALHHRLQHLAERNVPVLRSTGSQYLVLARKLAPAPRAPMHSTSAQQPVSNVTRTL
jgi:ubiquinone/menaquinone biosynthesis C-methylase UbiE